MRAFAAAFLLGLLLAVCDPAAAAGLYRIDPSSSSILFKIRHCKVFEVRARFDEFSGLIRYDPQAVSGSGVEVAIEVSSLSTGDPKLDSFLIERCFEVRQFPQVLFRSKEIEDLGGAYLAVADLSLHGVTQEVYVPFTVSPAGPTSEHSAASCIRVEGSFFIDRRDFGMSLGALLRHLVADNVLIELDIVATPVGASPESRPFQCRAQPSADQAP